MTARSSIAEVVAALRRGGVVAYPTEAVWGLGCDPRDEAATRRLLALKQRDVDKGLILIRGAVPGSKGGWIYIRDAVKAALPDNAPKPAALRSAAANSGTEATAAVGAE